MGGGLGERVTEGFSLSLQTEDLRPRKSLGMQGSQRRLRSTRPGPGGFSIFPLSLHHLHEPACMLAGAGAILGFFSPLSS